MKKFRTIIALPFIGLAICFYVLGAFFALIVDFIKEDAGI